MGESLIMYRGKWIKVSFTSTLQLIAKTSTYDMIVEYDRLTIVHMKDLKPESSQGDDSRTGKSRTQQGYGPSSDVGA